MFSLIKSNINNMWRVGCIKFICSHIEKLLVMGL